MVDEKTDIFDKGTRVTIVNNGEPGKDREVIVRDSLGRDELISVKKLWRRVK